MSIDLVKSNTTQLDPVDNLIKHVNRSDIARRTGIHLSHVSRVMNGKRSASVDNVELIAIAMGVSIGQVFESLHRVRQRYVKLHPKAISGRTLKRMKRNAKAVKRIKADAGTRGSLQLSA